MQAVCLKAMARKPEDRYPTARELALDVERYLADERVLAYAEPLVGRAWRWIRRHRTPVLSLMATALALIAVLSIGLGLLKVQRDRAERNFELAQQAVRDFYVQVSEETLLNQPGMQPLRDALLRQALDYYEQFLADRQDDPKLRREVALANFFVGRITETVDSPAKALPHFEQAAEVQQRLLEGGGVEDRATLEGEYAQTLNALGRALQNLRRIDDARRYYERAAQLREKLAIAAPKDAELARALASTLMNLGLVDLMTGKAAEALPRLERAQSLRLAHAEAQHSVAPKLQRDIGMGYFNLAQAHLAAGDLPAAETQLTGAIAAFEKLAEASPADFENRRKLAISHRMLGDAQAASGDGESAIESYEIARESLGELVARNPNVPEYAADLAGVRMNLAQQLDQGGDADGALDEMLAAVTLLRKVTATSSSVPRRQADLGVALRAAGQLMGRLDRQDEARAHFEESKRVLQALVREHPGEPSYASELQLTAEAIGELDGI
jgi:serine/threonine-protein kinase